MALLISAVSKTSRTSWTMELSSSLGPDQAAYSARSSRQGPRRITVVAGLEQFTQNAGHTERPARPAQGRHGSARRGRADSRENSERRDSAGLCQALADVWRADAGHRGVVHRRVE